MTDHTICMCCFEVERGPSTLTALPSQAKPANPPGSPCAEPGTKTQRTDTCSGGAGGVALEEEGKGGGGGGASTSKGGQGNLFSNVFCWAGTKLLPPPAAFRTMPLVVQGGGGGGATAAA